MKITPIKTEKVSPGRKRSLFDILDKYLPTLQNRSIVAITSKIVSICEGRVVKVGAIDKAELVKKEAQYYLPFEENKYGISLTIKNRILIPTAGIDESNGNGYYILWPADPQKTANEIREYLKKEFSLQNIGVIITDSRVNPVRWGTTGIAIAHSGFKALHNYIGKKDVFDRELKVSNANIVDPLAAAAVLIMGEGKEQTPLAVIEDTPVSFQTRNPLQKELNNLNVRFIEDDLFAPLLTSVKWRKGKK